MSMKVTIRIKGDAMIYEESDAWHITYITDDCHKLKFSADGALVDTLRSPGVVRYVTIDPANPVAKSRVWGATADNILNLNHHQLHGLDNGQSNLFTVAKSPAGRELVHMTIPFGEVTSENFVSYWCKEYPDGKKEDVDHKVARVIKISFELDEGPGLSLTVKDESGAKTYSYPHKKTLDLEFDNDCNAAGTEDDFLHYYDWVTDKRSTAAKQIRFIAGKIFPGGAVPESSTFNCDPTSMRPSPGGD